MPENFRHVDAPDVLTTFAGFCEMLDRRHAVPVVVTPSRPRPMMAGKPWDDQGDRLIEMYRQGQSVRKIADELGRTAHACRVRLYLMGYGRP